MMVMVDNNFLIGLVDDKNYYRVVIQALERDELRIGLPTPVLAEFLVRDDNYERELFLSKVGGFSQVYNFDFKSAQMSAEIMRNLIACGYFDNKDSNKQVVKVDIQILGITLANQVEQLFTTDDEIFKIVNLLKLPIEIVDFRNNRDFFGMSLFESTINQ